MMRMIRSSLVVAVVAASVAAPAAVSSAAKSPSRIVEAPYLTPVLGTSVTASGYGGTGYYYDCLNQIGCAIIDIKKGERFATLEIEDAAGQAAYGHAYLMPSGYELGNFCGKTDGPINIGSTGEILVHVISGTCPGGEPSVATQGVVKATLSRGKP